MRNKETESALPDGWKWTSIKSIGELISGQHIKTSNYTNEPSGMPYLTGPADFGSKYPSVSKWTSHPKAVARENDVLITVKGAGVGKTNILNVPEAAISRQLMAIRGLVALPQYIYYFIEANFDRFQKIGAGSTVPGIDRKSILNFNIPLAPLDEQQRIINKIEELLSDLDAGVAALKEVQRQLQRYRQSVLKAAVEGKLTEEWRLQHGYEVEPADKLLERILKERREKWEAEQLAKYEAQGKKPPKGWRERYKEPESPDTTELPELPEGWVWANLDQLSWDSQYGSSNKCDYDFTGPPVLRIPNLADGQISLEDIKYARASAELNNIDPLAPGDLLIIRTNGSKNLIGRSAIVKHPFIHEHFFASYLIRFRLVQDVSLSDWVSVIWDSPPIRNWVIQEAATSAGQYNISQTALRGLAVPLPPTSEQQVIAEVVEQLFFIARRSEYTVKHEIMRADRIRQSILKHAFEGKLVPQDPNDEPASALLERIKETTKQPPKHQRKNEDSERKEQLTLNL